MTRRKKDGTRCPGAFNTKGCPRLAPRGPRGGRCSACSRVRAGKRADSIDYKAIDPRLKREDVRKAREVVALGVGIKGALNVIQTMSRMPD